MAQDVRQNNLFAAEDFINVYRSFKNVDFRAYDFESLKQALIEYIKRNYPEDFNDYIESSEYIALIELLAYMGTSLSFRVDMNTRENFIDTAERRESIIRLAQMINYQPSRNIAANGLFKVLAVETTEPVSDSLGRPLNNVTVFWDDPNNEDSYDQFTAILNAAFISATPFGKPAKRGRIGGISTDIYQLDNLRNVQVTFPISISVNGERLPFDICNVDFDSEGKFFEKHPDPSEAFNVIYRNDGQGISSPNTGFFLYFRQGTLANYDYEYAFPEPNRNQEITDKNINQDDVYLQEIDQDGNVINKWEQVVYSRGNESVVYNTISGDNRKVYSVKSQANDAITLQFSDGTFGEIPTGIIRVWARKSANKKLIIRPEEVKTNTINIPYVGADGVTYNLRVIFGLEETVNNSAPSESNDEIKVRAPQVYYTQDRMVNNKDYNTFPLTRGNEIVKLKTINRTHAGHSRYLPVNDPTGYHQSLYITAADGAFYKDYQKPSMVVNFNPNLDSAESLVSGNVEDFLRNIELVNFLYDDYLDDYRLLKQSEWTSTSGYERDNVYAVTSQVVWNTENGSISDESGHLVSTTGYMNISSDFNSRSYGLDKFIEPGATMKFSQSADSINVVTAKILSLVDDQIDGSDVKKVVLNSIIPNGWVLIEVYPEFRGIFNEVERSQIADHVQNTSNFALEYIIGQGWAVIPAEVNVNAPFSLGSDSSVDNRWLFYAEYNSSSNQDDSTYTFISRGVKFVFESENDVRFFIDPSKQKNFSVDELVADMDEIIISGSNSASDFEETWALVDANNPQWVNSNGKISYPKNYIVLGSRSANSSNVKAVITYQQGDATIEKNVSANVENGVLNLVNESIPVGATVQLRFTGESFKLGKDYKLNTIRPFYEASGFLNPAKVEVTPADSNNDGIPDEPYIYNKIVGKNSLVFFETVTDANGDSFRKVWASNWYDLRDSDFDTLVMDYDTVKNTDLYLVKEEDFGDLLIAIDEAILTQISNNNNKLLDETTLLAYEASVFKQSVSASTGKIFISSDNSDIMSKLTVNKDALQKCIQQLINGGTPESISAQGGETRIMTSGSDDHYVFAGKSFTLDRRNTSPSTFDYRWRHFSPADNRIDPSISNIMDMIILTKTYYDEVTKWKKDNLGMDKFPAPPTTEELRANFSGLKKYKMMTDEIIFSSSSFKVIFGEQAPVELRAKFKIIKVPTTIMTDNEIKTKVVELIDEYFDINNWEFGETFYFTELAAYIHKGLVGIVASVILVPDSQESQFGNLFEVRVGSNELLIPTVKATDIIIVDTLTELNMRLN